MRWVSVIVLTVMVALTGCEKPAEKAVPSAAGITSVQLALNWVPEPEFGGIYAAQQQGIFKNHGLDVAISPGGAGAPTWQMVASGQVPFAIASADEVIIARNRGADVVALFATYQTCPQGIMVHQERGVKSLSEALVGGTLAIEKGLAYARYLEKKYGFDRLKLVAYDGGVAAFLADPNYAQQCFITSEPLAARKQGAKVDVFLVADSGYNPYTAVLIAKGDYVKKNPDVVRAMVASSREGWQAYLKDPKPANELMGSLNRTMDAQTFSEAADAQRPLVLPEGMSSEQLGTMTLARWEQLAGQLLCLKVIEQPVAATDCFVAADNLSAH